MRRAGLSTCGWMVVPPQINLIQLKQMEEDIKHIPYLARIQPHVRMSYLHMQDVVHANSLHTHTQ